MEMFISKHFQKWFDFWLKCQLSLQDTNSITMWSICLIDIFIVNKHHPISHSLMQYKDIESTATNS